MVHGVRAPLASVFDVAASYQQLTGPAAEALRRTYLITSAPTKCDVPDDLAAKYGVPAEQLVVSVTHRLVRAAHRVVSCRVASRRAAHGAWRVSSGLSAL